MIFNINVSNGRISKPIFKYKRRTIQIQFFKYSWVGLDLINRDTVVWSPNNDSVITAKSTYCNMLLVTATHCNRFN